MAALRLSLAAIALAWTVLILISPAPWVVRLSVVGLFGLSLVRPEAGLVAVTVIVFLSYSQVLPTAESIRLSEAAVVPFFAGWLIRARRDRRGPRVPGLIAWGIVAIAIAGAIIARLEPESVRPDAAVIVLEGLVLMAATVTLFRWYPRLARDLPIAMVSSALAGAIFSVLMIGEMSTSHLAAILCIAIGGTASGTTRDRRARPVWRLAAAASAGALFVAFSSGRYFPRSFDLMSAWTQRAGSATALLALSSVATAGTVIIHSARGLARSPRDYRLAGYSLGVAIETATWVVEPCRALSAQALPGWILVGLVAGLSASAMIETIALPPITAETAPGLRV